MTGIDDRIEQVQAMEAKMKRGDKCDRRDLENILATLRETLVWIKNHDERRNRFRGGMVMPGVGASE